jgi:hypothetical protein
MSVAIRITQDDATPALERMQQSLSGQQLAAACAEPLTALVQRHFFGLGTNKKGWHSTGFWERASYATNWQSDGSGVDIVCSQLGVRQRYYGGDINPDKKKWMTIPAEEEAYGHTAKEFSNLRFVLFRPDLAALMTKDEKKHVLFWLVKGVHQNPNPGVIPSDAEFDAEIEKGIANLLKDI